MSLGNAVFFPAGRFTGGAGAGRGGGGIAGRWRRFGEAVERALDAERGRWFLWLPVLFGCGIAGYICAPAEPPLALAVAGVLVAIPLRVFLRCTSFRLIFSSAVLMVALGFLDAGLRAALIDAPVLQRTMRHAQLDGWVERVERQEKRTRVTLRLIAVDGLKPEAMPRRVRVSLRGKVPPPLPATAIRLRATLMPPPEPALPGGFDFARMYWFSGLGASGYSTGKPELLAEAGAPWDLRASAAIAGFRQRIGERVAAVLSGDNGAIAQALIMGERGEISEEATVALRNAGLYHVISISGLHMALTAGSAYWLFRALLALIPGLALRFPIKIWAALGALSIATAYLVISGAAVTAVRSYIMIAIMFGAVILNRPVLSLRNVALSALAILVVLPESLTDAGFQMSFAATSALVAFYETRPAWRPPGFLPGAVGVPAMLTFEAGLTTLVASAAVDPVAAFHFHRIASYSMLGNVLASPLEALIVMPMALLSLAAMPFGLETWPLVMMERGIALMMWLSRAISALPGASIGVPGFSDGALLLMVAGALWLFIWTGRMRYWGLAVVAGGLALTPFHEQPDIWVDRDGRLVAVRDTDGRLMTPETRKAVFSLTAWMEADGDTRTPKEARKPGGFQCDEHSCVAMVKGRLVSYVQHPAALAEDCRRAAVLIAAFPLPERCPQPRVVIGLSELQERGAHTLMLRRDSIAVDTVASHRGARPWALPRHRREKVPPVAPVGGAGGGDEDSAGAAGDGNSANATSEPQ